MHETLLSEAREAPMFLQHIQGSVAVMSGPLWYIGSHCGNLRVI